MAAHLRLSHRYALAIKQLADERGETASLYQDFKKLRDLFKGSEDLRIFLRSPIIKPDTKVRALDRLMGGNLRPILRLFIEKLTKARRERLLGDIASEFVAMCDAEEGRMTAYLFTAWPLAPHHLDEIKQRIMHQLSSEGLKHLELIEQVKPELVGGFILQVGDRRVDASYASKLTFLRRQFSQNLYIKDF
ncbi:MAG: ATP synthase F1 subunit delta [Flavobacteriales bacterium]|nr:ATP synthase F1 subunit delta [Flavobacteriales bacterium]MCX7768299.1 ATP synthase F1 subunit delta [Flavobacteriales bacterium]MDW8409927.1 ATP synthase F1 subunit delta [Flavobacteriales bacterium]